ncbi:hypothetical protein BDV93DRAFT_515715 [Ceratobasidium sp. AG-I]|nr:hypothetical protein BDV93DRAFT_515715 [Ceratobasidium sp. AG-I]
MSSPVPTSGDGCTKQVCCTPATFVPSDTGGILYELHWILPGLRSKFPFLGCSSFGLITACWINTGRYKGLGGGEHKGRGSQASRKSPKCSKSAKETTARQCSTQEGVHVHDTVELSTPNMQTDAKWDGRADRRTTISCDERTVTLGCSVLEPIGTIRLKTHLNPTPQDVAVDEGGTARQHVVVEDLENPLDKEIVSAKRNSGEGSKPNVPEPSKPPARPFGPLKSPEPSETSQTPAKHYV